MEIYDIIKDTVKLSVRFVIKTIKNWEKDPQIVASQRGKHPKVKSVFREDENFRNHLREYVENNARRKGQRNLTLDDIENFVATYFDITEPEDRYSLKTIQRWLNELGFVRLDALKKKTYYDGHEAPQNIADRVRLYNEFKKFGSKL